MQTNLFKNKLLVEIKKQGVEFIHFVDISHLTKEQNKGYPTQEHVRKVMQHGLSDYHRKSYYIKAFQLGLEF